MSTAYTESGRVQQKQRTRADLVQATRRLIDSGDTPSVEDVAEAAGISRTTAYRYFPSQAKLLAAAFPETTAESLLPVPAPDDVAQRVSAVVTAIVDIIERTEPQQRAMLRLSLGNVPHELPLRQGRAIKWLTEALEPLRDELGDDGVRSLALALRSVCGIEARVWLRDIGGLASDDIRALQMWMTNALITRAADEAPPRR
ncbi:MAG: TetR/AcrR family transcriptional regulator [Actinomycetota bacterium]|nr:TetR/AcrR family transcriptional regulator [Actinomycetota bacterium]